VLDLVKILNKILTEEVSKIETGSNYDLRLVASVLQAYANFSATGPTFVSFLIESTDILKTFATPLQSCFCEVGNLLESFFVIELDQKQTMHILTAIKQLFNQKPA